MIFLAHNTYGTWLAEEQPCNCKSIQLTWSHNNMSLIHDIMDLEPEQLEELYYRLLDFLEAERDDECIIEIDDNKFYFEYSDWWTVEIVEAFDYEPRFDI